jgi:hypothetical protein
LNIIQVAVNQVAQTNRLSGNPISQSPFEDYDLKGCMEGGFLGITLSGSTPWLTLGKYSRLMNFQGDGLGFLSTFLVGITVGTHVLDQKIKDYELT